MSNSLRFSLDHLNVEKMPLKQGLEFLSKYLAIEPTRFQDRLRVVFDSVPETLTAIVPNMILQPHSKSGGLRFYQSHDIY